jgi:putative toxin-antitoxin system antitoxin component (TIGR02293 family)
MTATAEQLSASFTEWLGMPAASERSIVGAVESGLPTDVVARLLQHGLSKDEVFRIIVNPRTLKHRKSKKQRLSQEESERAVRTVRLIAQAEAVMGDRERALAWLRTPKRRFEGRSPMEMLVSEVGGRLVEQMLVQIDEGMFA